MITRLYVHNFRCLVAFKTEFECFGVLCGPNGAGKSSVFDALRFIRNLATGDATFGGNREQDVSRLEFTNWLKSDVQEFEIGVTCDKLKFEYVLHIQQVSDSEIPRIVKEQATCDGRPLFERDLKGVKIKRRDGTQAAFFPLDWHQTALASIQPEGHLNELERLQLAMENLHIIRPNPRGMERESKAESKRPDLPFTALTSWYRSLSQDLEWAIALRDLLQEVWPDFRTLKLVDVGLNTKALQLRFSGTQKEDMGDLFFEQLSDGEKSLIGLYIVRAALATGAAQTVFIDEPDNYVGLPELQPWVLSLRELLDENHQAILISHHPEILTSAGEANGRYLWRDNHRSPTRIGPLNVPEGMNPGEAIARGWVRG